LPPRPSRPEQYPHIATRFPTLDHALGIGGIPSAALTECISSGTSGLTTLALKVIAQAQADYAQASAVWVDTTASFDADYAVRCGVVLDRLLVVRTDCNIADILHTLVTSSGVSVLVCDMRHGLQGAPLPRLEPLAMSRITTALASTECALLLLTEPSLSPGYTQAALRLQLTRERWLIRTGDVVGYRVQVHILKNRFAPAERRVSITIGFSILMQGDRL
jgi:recombination protein RecA